MNIFSTIDIKELLTNMFEWLSARDPILVYIFLYCNALFESIFPPYPSDAFVLVIAFLAGQGHFSPYFIYLFTIIGSISGIMIIYHIGRSKGGCERIKK